MCSRGYPRVLHHSSGNLVYQMGCPCCKVCERGVPLGELEGTARAQPRCADRHDGGRARAQPPTEGAGERTRSMPRVPRVHARPQAAARRRARKGKPPRRSSGAVPVANPLPCAMIRAPSLCGSGGGGGTQEPGIDAQADCARGAGGDGAFGSDDFGERSCVAHATVGRYTAPMYTCHTKLSCSVHLSCDIQRAAAVVSAHGCVDLVALCVSGMRTESVVWECTEFATCRRAPGHGWHDTTGARASAAATAPGQASVRPRPLDGSAAAVQPSMDTSRAQRPEPHTSRPHSPTPFLHRRALRLRHAVLLWR
jgi:hypothetical protein